MRIRWNKLIKGIVFSWIYLLFIFLILQGIWSVKYGQKIFLSTLLEANNLKENLREEDKTENNAFGKENDISSEASLNIEQEQWKLEINAKGVIVLETDLSSNNKILFQKNIEEKFPIASLTKIMTALVAIENYDLSQKIEGKSVRDLIYLTLINSNNESAITLAKEIGEKEFVFLMNKKAEELGMKNSFFDDSTGLSDKNISSVNDLVKLAKYILTYHPEIFYISRLKEYDIPNFGRIFNTNQLLKDYPEIIGGKTGFTEEAKGCLLLVLRSSREGYYTIYIILGSEDRFGEMKKMIEWVKKNDIH